MPSPDTFFDTYTQAVSSLEPSTLLALYSEDARVFDSMAPDEYADKAAWAEMVEEWLGGLREGTATVRDGQVIESDDLAVLTGHVTYAGVLEDGEDVEVECRITLVLEKVGDTWTIVHEHTSVPIDMEDMEDEE